MTNVVSLSFLALQLVCADPGAWRFSQDVRTLEPDVEEVTVVLSSSVPRQPPAFRIEWNLPQCDIPYFWRADRPVYGIPADWDREVNESMIARWLPVYSLFSDSDENRLAVATDDARRPVGFTARLREEDCRVYCAWDFFSKPSAPSTGEVVRLRFDRRKVFWSDAIADAAAWVSATPGYGPLGVPAAAFEPLYSSWYGFHQDVFDREIEAECALAAPLGMKTVIVDDGWETDSTARGFDFCGDWEISKRRFPDMAAHVKRVHALGMRYMVWFSVPYVGVNSKACAKFRGRYLREPKVGRAGVLDPRFPEVREYLANAYETAVREWDLDGLKLDFIDSFSAEPGVPEAVDALMTDVARRLKAVKPEILIEFRQGYIGPAIRKYGNMFRVGDCPGDMSRNRIGIARLRLTSGGTAVHSDMLEWNPADSAENAARFILNSIFGTVQYSMMLRTLPKRHLEMMRHWIGFSRRHEQALLHGSFRPHGPQRGYPLLVGEGADERIIGVYGADLAVDAGSADRKVFVLNATQRDRLAIRLAKDCAIIAYDTFGREVSRIAVPAGLQEAICPASGYLEITFNPQP